MKKVKVLRLSGCPHCRSFITALDDLGITYTSIDANDNGKLADEVELLLDTYIYPIVIVTTPDTKTYLHLADNSAELGYYPLNYQVSKIACATTDEMVEQLKTLLNN